MSAEVDAYLAHAGVKGMRWGHRKRETPNSSDRGPSTPTRDERRAAKRETKATKFDGKAKHFDTTIKDLDAQIKAMPPGIRSAYQRNTLTDVRNELSKERDRAVKDAQSVREGKLTSTQKRVIIGASVVAALAATYVIQDNIQSGNATRLIAKGKERITGEQFKFNKKPSLSNPDWDVDDIHRNVVKHINPEFGAMGTKMNCRRATFSYEMRRRGYDVKATKTTNANGQNTMGLLNALSPGKKIQNTSAQNVARKTLKEATYAYSGKEKPVTDLSKNFAAGGKQKIPGGSKSIFDTLAKEPDGSRGELGVMWNMGGGHSMAYEVVKGKPVVFDGQTGKVYKTPLEFMDMPAVKNAGFTRLDNVDLNVDYLMRWMTNA